MNNVSKKMLSVVVTTVGALISSPAFAQDANHSKEQPLESLIQVLKENGTLTGKQFEQLNSAVSESIEAQKKAAASSPKIETDGKFQVTSADGKSSFRIGGRLHLDGSLYNNDDKTDFTNGFDVRRARLEFQGTVQKYWDWKFDYDFGQTSEVRGGYRDAFMRYRVPDTTSSITVGQFKEFFGLEHMNSSNDLAFVERSVTSRVFHDIAESSDGRRLGIGWNVNDKEQFTFALGVFGRNAAGDSSDSSKDPFAVESRVTYSPVHQDGHAIHAGVSANYISLNDSTRGKLSARPEGRLGTHPLVETGEISDSDAYSRYGAEFGAVEGAFWTQAEFIAAAFHRDSGPTPVFTGWHADVGYVLTGESRVYDFDKGTFKNPKVAKSVGEGNWGAWELAARFSGIDLSDEDIDGGREMNVSAGVNWYANNNFRMMLTYTQVVDVNGGTYDDQTPSELLLRSQFNF